MSAASDEKAGATVRKLERYDEFFAGFDDLTSHVTFYQRAFPDGWPAEVLFLVRKEGRRERVNAALAGWRAAHGPCAVSARAVTLEDPVRELGAALGATPSIPPPAQGLAPVSLAPDDFDTLRCFYQAALRELGASGRPLLEEALRATALRARAVLSRDGQVQPGASGGEGR